MLTSLRTHSSYASAIAPKPKGKFPTNRGPERRSGVLISNARKAAVNFGALLDKCRWAMLD